MFASISDQLINTAIILDMMFNTEMIVKVLKGGKEDMTKKVIETVNGWYMENPKQKVELDDIVGLVKTDEPTNSVQLKKEAQLSIYEKRIIELKKENKQLKQQLNRLYNYFEDWYSDMTSANDFNEIWDNVKEDERWGDMEFTPSCNRHLKKSDFESLHSIIDGYEINCKIEELRRLGYSDEYINKELSHLVNWRI